MKIITADQRAAEKSGPKILIVGPSGVVRRRYSEP
jgi:hypothetical protein